MAQNNTTLLELSESISRNSKLLDEYISSNGLPQPGFDRNAPIGFEWLKDAEVAQARAKLVNDTRKLYFLMMGHEESFRVNTITVRLVIRLFAWLVDKRFISGASLHRGFARITSLQSP